MTTEIRKIRETSFKDWGNDWDEWPFPTVTIESVISGDLRARILSKLEIPDRGQEVRIEEEQVSGGYSEYTQEDECSIKIEVAGKTAWHRNNDFSTDSAMASFLQEFAGS